MVVVLKVDVKEKDLVEVQEILIVIERAADYRCVWWPLYVNEEFSTRKL